MALTTIDDRGLKTPIDLLDNEKIRFGTGNDLSIHHNGSDSIINQTTQNDLWIKHDSDAMAAFKADGAVELYHDNSLKAYTTAGGFKVDNKLEIPDGGATGTSARIVVGNGDDLKIYHDSSSSYISNNGGNLYIESKAGETAIQAIPDGAVDLRYNGSKKFETMSSGVQIENNNAPSTALDSTPVKLVLHNATNHNWDHDEHCGAIIFRKGLGDDASVTNNIVAGITATHTRTGSSHTNEDGGIQIWTSPSANPTVPEQVWEFDSLGSFVGKDNRKILLGDSNDLQLYHDGTDSQITNATGKLYFKSDDEFWFQKNNGSNVLYVNPDGGTILYTNSAAKLETSGSGITVYGSVTETSDVALKKDITPLSDSLAKVKQLKGYSYKFKETDIEAIGFTAQDVEKIYPALVEGEEGKKGLNYGGLIAPLVEAVKELSAKVETLETKVAALEAE